MSNNYQSEATRINSAVSQCYTNNPSSALNIGGKAGKKQRPLTGNAKNRYQNNTTFG